MDHLIEIAYFATYRQYRAECSCGWVGSYVSSESAAKREFETTEYHREGDAR